MCNLKILIFRLLFVLFVLTGTSYSFSQHQEQLLTHVETLASPIFAGRETGSWGQKLAAIYIQEFLGDLIVDPFELTFIQDGGTIIVNQDTLKYKNDFFYLGFDVITQKNLIKEQFEVVPLLKLDNYERKPNTSDKLVIYLVDDWEDYLEFYGHQFNFQRYLIDGDSRPKEIFVNMKSMGELDFASIELNLVAKKAVYYTENLIYPIYWNANNTETIVLCAHYDHLGEAGDIYYPGADDNASGVAVLLELAQLFKDTNIHFSKNIQLVFFSGEEQGMYGSKYMVHQSPYFQTNTVLCINLDMVGFLYSQDPAVYMVDYTFDEVYSDLFGSIEGPVVDFRLVRQENFLNEFSSDHLSFVDQEIDAIMFFTGLHAYYHTPEDTPEKLNYEAMNVLVLTLYQLIMQIGE